MENGSPLIVNLGLGRDSVALLVGLAARNIRPDIIIFSDVGSEKPETIGYIETLAPWLARNNFPAVTVVRRYGENGTHGEKSRRSKTGDGYRDHTGNLHQNRTLPTLAFGMKSCSLKWKAEVMDKWLEQQPIIKAARAAGIKPVKMIGYDAGPRDSKRAVNRTEDTRWIYRYPLREWSWDRKECGRRIVAAGLPVPLKSACYFCPASQKWEVAWLRLKHPKLFDSALNIERNARHDGPGGWGKGSTCGLGRKWSWGQWADDIGLHAMSEDEVKNLILELAPKDCDEPQVIEILAERVMQAKAA